jgi:ankyrin repeat protein
MSQTITIDGYDKHGRTALLKAIKAGKKAEVQFLLDQGADINKPERASKATPLYFAINFNQLEIARLLIARKAKINQAEKNGVSPFYKAMEDKNLKAAQFLVENGADVNQVDKDGISSVYRCAEINFLKGLEFLHKHHADFDVVTNDKVSPLYISAQNNYTSVVNFLVKTVKVNVNSITKHGISAAYVAAYQGHEAIVTTLLNCWRKRRI